MTLQIPPAADFTWAQLVPEMLISDLSTSLRFWRDLCGFRVVFDRPEEGFAYLDRDGAQIMLDQRGLTRDWETGAMEAPFGRGVNFGSACRPSSRSWRPSQPRVGRCFWRPSGNGTALATSRPACTNSSCRTPMAISSGSRPGSASGQSKGQTVYKPGSVPSLRMEMAIHLGRPLPNASRDRPERRREDSPGTAVEAVPAAPTWSCSRWGLPCPRHYCRGGALLPHHFTLAAP